MKKRSLVLLSFLSIGLLTFWLMGNDYELRLVPNKLEQRPRLNQPSPHELSEQFQLQGGSERDNRGFPKRDIEDLATLFPKVFLREGPRENKVVAFTFDDGPDSVYTPQFLDIFKEHNIKATFFLIGSRAKLFPDVVKRMAQEGHIVANHSMNHPNILKLSKKDTAREILDAEEVLYSLVKYRPALFRSPYGSLNSQKVRDIEELGYKIIAWNVDSLDWKSLSAEQVKYNILENVTEGSIILQHSSGSEEEDLTGSVSAMEDIIRVLKKEGYKFVTIPEMFDMEYKK